MLSPPPHFVLGTSPSATVIAGDNGWLFYADDRAVDDYAQLDPIAPDLVANWRAALPMPSP